MKTLLLFVSLFCLAQAARAVDLLDGYIVKAGGDTIRCKIKGGRFLTSPFSGVTTVNEQGEEQSLKGWGEAIIAFGFIERNHRYDYLYIKTGDKLENGYYQRLIAGPRYKLYTSPTRVYGGNPTYVLFNPAGAFTRFEPCVVCPWKKALRELLKDDPTALEMVDKAPRVDIPKFVRALNEATQPQ